MMIQTPSHAPSPALHYYTTIAEEDKATQEQPQHASCRAAAASSWPLDKQQHSSSSSSPVNVWNLLQRDAPQEVMTHVLAFAGPSATFALGGTSRFWHAAAHHETTYQALCEVTSKPQLPSVRLCNNTAASSYKQWYWENICVPHDCPTLHQAVRLANSQFAHAAQAGGSGKRISIWLQPAHDYRLEDTLIVRAVGPNACLVLHTLPTSNSNSSETPRSNKKPRRDSHSNPSASASSSSSSSDDDDDHPNGERALLSMDTEISNQPMIRLTAGALELRHVTLEHYSPVQLADLIHTRNENAALLLCDTKQRQSVLVPQSKEQKQQPTRRVIMEVPTLTLDGVDITSFSGRGVLNRCRGRLTVHNSFVSKFW
jgi:hypothetical protein